MLTQNMDFLRLAAVTTISGEGVIWGEGVGWGSSEGPATTYHQHLLLEYSSEYLGTCLRAHRPTAAVSDISIPPVI